MGREISDEYIMRNEKWLMMLVKKASNVCNAVKIPVCSG